MEGEMLLKVGFTNLALVKEEIWFCDIYHSNLIKMELNTGNVSMETVLLPENVNGKMQYGPIVSLGNQLILAPRNGDNILIYNICTKELRRLPLKKTEIKLRKPLFLTGFAYEGNAFFIPGNYPAVVKVNLQNISLEYFEDFYYGLPASIRDRNNILCNSNAVIIDDYCVFPVYCSNIFIKVYLDFRKYEIILTRGSEHRTLNMAYVDASIWFAGFDGIFEYNCKEENVVCYNELFTQSQLANGIGQVAVYQESLVIVPVNGEKLFLFDRRKHDYVEFQNFLMPLSAEGNEKGVLTGSNITCCEKVKEDTLCLYSTYAAEVCLINLKNQSVQQYEGKLASWQHGIGQMIGLHVTHHQVINENDIGLANYIKYIKDIKE